MKHGQVGDPHDVVHPQYQTWGLRGGSEVKTTQSITNDNIHEILSILEKTHVNLKGYQPFYADRVPYYQGEHSTTEPILIRFEREDGVNNGYQGEHITVIYDTDKHELLGLTRMQAHLDRGENFISHQVALNAAIGFLKVVAPDLIPQDEPFPELNTLANNQRMEFIPDLKIGNMEFNWMDDHPEEILNNGHLTKVHGMKIKAYLPSTQLWAWVIIDKNGDIQTFEKNVSWDFDKMIRETQMWLHDKWLQEHNIKLQRLTKNHIITM